jgi:heterodisulfide reductase subunit A-like polyferredoxin
MPNVERRTPNVERRTPNAERRTTNAERRTTNVMTQANVVLIGGGVNGLVTATLLARSGLKVILLERSDRVGGCARTDEIAPG